VGQVSWIHVEVNFSGEPLFADFAKQGGDEAEQGCFVWKKGGDAGSAFEFLINAFDGVTCAHAVVVGAEGTDTFRRSAFRLSAHLVLPGPDIMVESMDHTLKAALQKLDELLLARIHNAPASRLKKSCRGVKSNFLSLSFIPNYI
jgi:hypothetical protein